MLVENLIEHGNLYAALSRSSLDRERKEDALTALAKAHDLYLEAAEYASLYSRDANSEALDRLAQFREKLDVLHQRFDNLPKAAWSQRLTHG